MTVSGWVLTLENDERLRACVLEALERDSRITCGVAHGLRLPLVVETAEPTESETLFESLRNLPGVAFIDVVSIVFEEAC